MTASRPSNIDFRVVGLAMGILAFGISMRILIGNASLEALGSFGPTRIYLMGLVYEWSLFAFTVWTLARSGESLRDFIDRNKWTPQRLLGYIAAAIVALVAWALFAFVLAKAHILRVGPMQLQHIRVLFPRTPLDKALWVMLSLSAGFCEELAYRGLILRRGTRLTNSVAGGIVVQSLVYASAHAALPWPLVLTIALLGLMFGTLATAQRSLVPGILLHATMDILALFRR
jgi:membrane protease YdiL (CAAX protease family)